MAAAQKMYYAEKIMNDYQINECKVCGQPGDIGQDVTGYFYVECPGPVAISFCINTTVRYETIERAVHAWNKNNKPAILGFQGEYRWLSNFHPVQITCNYGLKWPSTEHAYQAYKCGSPKSVHAEISTLSSGAAKRYGQMIDVVPYWDRIKRKVMLELNRYKYTQNLSLKLLLLETRNRYIEETNSWNDKFWGVCEGEGENHLGRILMQIRDEEIYDPS